MVSTQLYGRVESFYDGIHKGVDHMIRAVQEEVCSEAIKEVDRGKSGRCQVG